MSDWSRLAHASAARKFGERHYRWYAMREHSGAIAGIGAVIACLAVVAGGAWWAIGHVHLHPVIVCLTVAIAAFGIGGLRLAYLLSPARRGPVRGSGGLGWAILAFVAGVAGAIWFS